MKKKQQKMEMILDSKKIQYNKLDIAADEELKIKMRRIMGDPKGLPPQLCKGEEHLGVSRIVPPLSLTCVSLIVIS